MKKIAFLLLVLLFAGSGNAQTTKTKFYYYPAANVYYNSASEKYIYNNNGNWTAAKTLPHGIAVANTRRVIVYHNSAQVWENNTEHKTKYKPTKFKSVPPGQLKKKAISRSR
jgi:hypothetical protein